MWGRRGENLWFTWLYTGCATYLKGLFSIVSSCAVTLYICFFRVQSLVLSSLSSCRLNLLSGWITPCTSRGSLLLTAFHTRITVHTRALPHHTSTSTSVHSNNQYMCGIYHLFLFILRQQLILRLHFWVVWGHFKVSFINSFSLLSMTIKEECAHEIMLVLTTIIIDRRWGWFGVDHKWPWSCAQLRTPSRYNRFQLQCSTHPDRVV